MNNEIKKIYKINDSKIEITKSDLLGINIDKSI